MKKPTILITNDDGIKAGGLRYLISVMRKLGDVLVVASNEPNSGQGHAITVRTPLRCDLVKESKNYKEYVTNGTPVDCVKLAEQIVLKGKPDIIVSGVNHGSNASVNVVYSGTMAAVVEGCIGGVPAIGFSLNSYDENADFSACGDFIKEITKKVFDEGLSDGICLNVNIPAVPKKEIKGVKVCRQANARWIEEYAECKDPRQRDYFWLTGYLEKLENNEDTDQWAIDNNYISVVPIHYDLTSHKSIEKIKLWNLNGYGF
jgi:5'-nucleotidase